MNKNLIFNRKRPFEYIFKNETGRLLDFFIFNEQFSYSVREISIITEIEFDDVKRSIQRLLKQGIITQIGKDGSANLYILNLRNALTSHLVEFVNSSINREINESIKKKIVAIK
ncbi:MAG: hypothetical protein ACPKQO_10605 [Nitrososphaeraceae archaeon]